MKEAAVEHPETKGEYTKDLPLKSFEYKGDGYAQDAFDAYYRGRKIE